MTHRRAVLILTGCTLIWGGSFTVNKMALAVVSPLLLIGIRFTLASTLMARIYPAMTREDWRIGLRLGVLFGVQLALFITGLDRIPSNRAAFLFSIATPLVPLLVPFVERRRPRPRDLVAVSLAVAGTWWLTRPDSASGGLVTGDWLILGAALCGAIYVVAAGHFGPRHEPMHLLAAQLPVMAFIGLGLAALLERPRIELGPWTVFLIIFLALSSIAGFGGQLVGQRKVRATEAALIFALEPVFAAVASFAALGERLVGTQWLGAGMILAGMLSVRPSPSTPPVPGPGPITEAAES